jgi:cobalt-precorrin-7 (C5)-methyltransferase
VKIVGVGVGPGMLTMEAAKAIEDAEVVYGSKRAIELAAEHIFCETKHIQDYSRLHELPDNAVVLSTGDPNLSGLGKFAGPRDVVIPGISSLQAACARLHIDQSGIVVITAHGRDPAPAAVKLRSAITSGFTVFLLPAYEFGVKQVAAMLLGMGIDIPIAVFERLGYMDERVEMGSVSKPPGVNSGLYCIMVGYAVV